MKFSADKIYYNFSQENSKANNKTYAITSLHSKSSNPFKFLIIISDAILSDIWIIATPGLFVKNFI